jgi:cobalt/nickel transport system permease protein
MTDAQQNPSRSSNRSSLRFIESNLAEISHLIERSVFAETLAHHNGLLQGLDPRIKIVTLLALLIAAGLSHNLWVIIALYGLTLILAWVSHLPLKMFITRVWLFMPFFTGVIALPALFLTPGPALMHLPLGLIITRSGALTALFLLFRVGTSVSMTILIILTTPWNSLLKAFKVLYVPDVIILILGMTYRYIYLLLITSIDMFLSRKSRIVGRLSGAEERQLVASTAGVLLSRSLQISSEVYMAMQSRGFYRTPRTMDNFKIKTIDWVFGSVVVIISATAIWIGR